MSFTFKASKEIITVPTSSDKIFQESTLISLVTDEQEKAENDYSRALLSPTVVFKSLTLLKLAAVNVSTLSGRPRNLLDPPAAFVRLARNGEAWNPQPIMSLVS